jgi:predicted nucleic acid-binding protein
LSDYIVDASVAAKWFLPETFAGEASKILRSANRLYAPDFLLLEMDNVFCKRVRRGEMSADEAREARLLLRKVSINYSTTWELQDEAYLIAVETKSSLYDCLYLALGVRRQAPMLTADRRLFENILSGPFSKFVAWVEDI